jgi:hypothetical protein
MTVNQGAGTAGSGGFLRVPGITCLIRATRKRRDERRLRTANGGMP